MIVERTLIILFCDLWNLIWQHSKKLWKQPYWLGIWKIIMITWAGISNYKSNDIIVACVCHLSYYTTLIFLKRVSFEFANYLCRKTSHFSHRGHPHKYAMTGEVRHSGDLFSLIAWICITIIEQHHWWFDYVYQYFPTRNLWQFCAS